MSLAGALLRCSTVFAQISKSRFKWKYQKKDLSTFCLSKKKNVFSLGWTIILCLVQVVKSMTIVSSIFQRDIQQSFLKRVTAGQPWSRMETQWTFGVQYTVYVSSSTVILGYHLFSAFLFLIHDVLSLKYKFHHLSLIKSTVDFPSFITTVRWLW